MSVRVVLTHVYRYQVAGEEAADAIGLVAAAEDAPAAGAGESVRVFVPGFLPCGECALCRRSLVGACRGATRPLAAVAPPAAIEAERRFVTPIDEPAGVAPLADETAVHAGVVAFALHAHALASLAPGDVALWIGATPLAAVGAAVATASGAHAFSAAATASAASLGQQLAATTANPDLAHGARKPLLFLADPTPPAWQLAATLAEPGATIVALGTSSLPPLALPRDTRLTLLSAYHPDFLPEALAMLRRDSAVAATASG